MRERLRPIAAPFLVALPGGRRIRTRLHPDASEAAALRQLGETLGSLAGRDLMAACRGERRAPRKQALTKESSSRWAGALTRTSDDLCAARRRNLFAERRSLTAAIAAIEKRLATAVGSRGGYRSQFERTAKQQRLQRCKARLVEVERQISQRDFSIVRGGGKLLNTRHNVAAAELTEAQWRARWSAARLFLTADGESGKRFGNETIRVSPAGAVTIKTPGGRLHLAVPISFNHRREEWLARVLADQCVRYDIGFDPEKGRWYLDASWRLAPVEYPPIEQVTGEGVLGIDLNADHLAAWQLDASGNPVGKPMRIEIDLKGLPATTRDARIREVCSELVRTAKRLGLRALAVEKLGFVDTRDSGRETLGHRKHFRKTVCGMPTAQFRERLVAAAANGGVLLVAVDPAYTSRWGAQHWQRPLSTKLHPVTRHNAAAVVIGRRALGLRARRTNPGVTDGDQANRIAAPSRRRATGRTTAASGTKHERRQRTQPDGDRAGPAGPKTRPAESTRPAPKSSAEDRSRLALRGLTPA